MGIPIINVMSKNIKNIKMFPIMFLIFRAEKDLCILHRQVFVMYKYPIWIHGIAIFLSLNCLIYFN